MTLSKSDFDLIKAALAEDLGGRRRYNFRCHH
jgi:hypothetical protein